MSISISRSEYNTKKRSGYACDVEGMDPDDLAATKAASPWWDGRYLMMVGSDGNVGLVPVNVVPDPKTPKR